MCFCSTRKILKQLKQLRKEVKAVRFMVSRPGVLCVRVLEEVGMSISFAVVLPVPPENQADWNEVANGNLKVVIDGGEPIALTTEKAAQETEDRLVKDDRFVGPQGATVSCEFHYTDDAGNVGNSVYATSLLADTIPPVTPTELGVVAIGEIVE